MPLTKELDAACFQNPCCASVGDGSLMENCWSMSLMQWLCTMSSSIETWETIISLPSSNGQLLVKNPLGMKSQPDYSPHSVCPYFACRAIKILCSKASCRVCSSGLSISGNRAEMVCFSLEKPVFCSNWPCISRSCYCKMSLDDPWKESSNQLQRFENMQCNQGIL